MVCKEPGGSVRAWVAFAFRPYFDLTHELAQLAEQDPGITAFAIERFDALEAFEDSARFFHASTVSRRVCQLARSCATRSLPSSVASSSRSSALRLPCKRTATRRRRTRSDDGSRAASAS